MLDNDPVNNGCNGVPRGLTGTFGLPSSPSEHEVGRADQAEPGPKVIELDRLMHVKHCEGHEHRECNHFLQDLQLRERHRRVADAVSRHLQQIFKKGDAPTQRGGDKPMPGVPILQMRVPRKSHEGVRADQ
jgi:hypothetical protein